MDSEVTVGVEMANLRTCITQHAKLFAQYPLSAEVKADPETGMLKSKLRLPQRVSRDFFCSSVYFSCFKRTVHGSV